MNKTTTNENFLKRIGLVAKFDSLKLTYPILKFLYDGPYTVWKIIASVITLFTSLFFYFYILGYCFIYGYYFSGNIESLPSILNITINPVPIQFHSVSLISIFLFLAFVSLFSLMNIFKLKNLIAITMSAIFILFVFHLGISIFFVPGHDVIDRFTTFLPVWIIPILLSGLIMSFVVLMRNPILFFSGIIYGICIMMLVIFLLERKFGIVGSLSGFIEKASVLILIISFCIASIFVILVNRVRNFRTIATIALLPFICFPIFVLNHYIMTILNWRGIYFISVLIAFIISCFVSYFSSNLIIYFKNKHFNSDDEIGNYESSDILKKNLRVLIICTIPCLIIFVSVIFAYISLVTGNYIRTMSPEGFRKFQVIEDYKEDKVIKGNIIKNEDDTYYISNENWELEILHSDHMYIKNQE